MVKIIHQITVAGIKSTAATVPLWSVCGRGRHPWGLVHEDAATGGKLQAMRLGELSFRDRNIVADF